MKLKQPEWPRHLPAPAVLGLATLGPVGRRLPAPGTWGSLAGLLYYHALFYGRLGPAGSVILSAAGAYLAVGICGEAERLTGRTDPSEVILDEVVAMPLCFLGWPYLSQPLPSWAVLIAGLCLFRLFDIFKPLYINRLQKLPGGWGVVVDDIAAALATCATLHLLRLGWALIHAN
jgi:phosphatidylglycerophosphatase A